MPEGAAAFVEVVDLSITVASGTGTANYRATGEISSVAIKPPSGTPTLNVEILDEDNFPVFIRSGVKARTKIPGDNALCKGLQSLTISSATIDGTYLLRIYMKLGYSYAP